MKLSEHLLWGGVLPIPDLFSVGGNDFGDLEKSGLQGQEIQMPQVGWILWRWHSRDHRSSRQGISWVPHVGHGEEPAEEVRCKLLSGFAPPFSFEFPFLPFSPFVLQLSCRL